MTRPKLSKGAVSHTATPIGLRQASEGRVGCRCWETFGPAVVARSETGHNRSETGHNRPRRGSIYPIVLGTALIVAVLGLSALMSLRIQRGQFRDVDDSTRAALYARAAIDMALYRMQHDPDWRQKMQDEVWEADQPLGTGSYRFRAFDPLDDDLTDSPYHPVIVVGTGSSGRARHHLRAQVHIRQPGLRCLEPALHAEDDVRLDGVTVVSDGPLSANDSIQAENGTQVYADAEAAGVVTASGGSVFHGQVTNEEKWPREMPDLATVFDHYLDQATFIPIGNLPYWDANRLDDPGMEDLLLSDWEPYGDCEIGGFLVQPNSGLQSIRVNNRRESASGAGQHVTERIQSGETYYSEIWVRPGKDDEFRIALELTSTGDGVQSIPLTDWAELSSGSWQKIQGTATVNWMGTLTQAIWYVETRYDIDAYRVDDAVFRIAEVPSGWRALHRRVLSPASNPFGATNPQGIYAIDCAGAKLSVKDCRIVGTLLLLNQNGASKIHGSMHWAPAVYGPDPAVPNLPALLTNEVLNLAFHATPLDEGQVNVNFNPPGTPYEGVEDTVKDGSYPSLIQGVVYGGGRLFVENHPTLHGVLVGHDDIRVDGTNLDLTYDPVYFRHNPPPGFRAPLRPEIVPGSFRQVVD